MKSSVTYLWILLTMFVATQSAPGADGPSRTAGLDAYWSEVSRAVREGDFEAYRATCHAEGVLVSGISEKSQPLSEALTRWKPGFEDTQAGTRRAVVKFRFSRRMGDATTAHETGIFFYSTVDPAGKTTSAYIHFEALLKKKNSKWLILMEYQKSNATLKEWNALNGKKQPVAP